jgi:hypothetical protein
MEIPLKRKYRIHKPVKMNKSNHNDGNKKRGNGWAKHKGAPKGWKGEPLHVQYVMILQANGKRRFMPQSEWEALNGEAA